MNIQLLKKRMLYPIVSESNCNSITSIIYAISVSVYILVEC